MMCMVNTAKCGAIIGIIGCAIRVVFPANPMITYVIGAIVMFATVPMISVLPILICNTVEYNKNKYDVYLAGMANSTSSFGQKIGTGVGVAMVSWVLAIGGFGQNIR